MGTTPVAPAASTPSVAVGDRKRIAERRPGPPPMARPRRRGRPRWAATTHLRSRVRSSPSFNFAGARCPLSNDYETCLQQSAAKTARVNSVNFTFGCQKRGSRSGAKSVIAVSIAQRRTTLVPASAEGPWIRAEPVFNACAPDSTLPGRIGWKIRPRPGDVVRQHRAADGAVRKSNKLRRCQLIKIS